VAIKDTDTLFSRVGKLAHSVMNPMESLVPVDDFAVYYLVASEIARMIAKKPGQDLCIFIDSQTAIQVDAVNNALADAKRLFVFGTCPEAWTETPNVVTAQSERISPKKDFFLAVLSNNISFALICEKSGDAFHGAWTALRADVIRIIEAIVGSSSVAVEATDCLASRILQPDDRSMSCALRLMELLTRQLAWRQRDIANDKADLFAVLNILRSVGAQQRADETLYRFVKQIASSVRVDRCSIIRVWEGDNCGHVLASHEDESVKDLVIDLAKYPEITRVMETRETIIINDAQHDPLLEPFSDILAQANFNVIIVVPIVLFDPNVGTFLLSGVRSEGPFTLRETSFCEIAAKATANALERTYLFESVQKANKQLEIFAITDALTGIYNRRYFHGCFDKEFERAQRRHTPLSCMIMDIDDFKKVNDTFGHSEGDIVLRAVSDAIASEVRERDTLARYGGEEFVVFMPKTGIEEARELAERVRKAVKRQTYEGMPKDYPITISIGVAEYNPETMPDSDAIVRVADTALYVAKREGKNRVIVGES